MGTERERAAAQTRIFSARFEQREDYSRREVGPCDLTGNALQHGEHGVIFRQNAADGLGRVYAQGLQLPQQEQAKNVINIRIGENRSSDR